MPAQLHDEPAGQLPQLPPQPSGPQSLLAHLGRQVLPSHVPFLQVASGGHTSPLFQPLPSALHLTAVLPSHFFSPGWHTHGFSTHCPFSQKVPSLQTYDTTHFPSVLQIITDAPSQVVSPGWHSPPPVHLPFSQTWAAVHAWKRTQLIPVSSHTITLLPWHASAPGVHSSPMGTHWPSAQMCLGGQSLGSDHPSSLPRQVAMPPPVQIVVPGSQIPLWQTKSSPQCVPSGHSPHEKPGQLLSPHSLPSQSGTHSLVHSPLKHFSPSPHAISDSVFPSAEHARIVTSSLHDFIPGTHLPLHSPARHVEPSSHASISPQPDPFSAQNPTAATPTHPFSPGTHVSS